MQLSFRNIWIIVKNVFGSSCFLGIVLHAATHVDQTSLPGKDKFVAGCALENINPAGFQMCRKLCEGRTDCCLINFNVDKLTCSLLSSPCSGNDSKIESKKGYIYDFRVKDNRTLTERNNCQFSKCFSLSAGPEICMNYTAPRDCHDIQTVKSNNQQESKICPQQSPRYRVRCTLCDGSTWTVIQKRFDGSQDFNKNWDEYKHGFGTPTGEFWIGNQALYELTSTARYELMIIINDSEGNQYHARYTTFFVGSESSNFVLTIGGYSGNAGNKMLNHDGMQFTTYNGDNDYHHKNCAGKFKGGWWYKSCYNANLNGKIMDWNGLKFNPLKSSIMAIRRF